MGRAWYYAGMANTPHTTQDPYPVEDPYPVALEQMHDALASALANPYLGGSEPVILQEILEAVREVMRRRDPYCALPLFS